MSLIIYKNGVIVADTGCTRGTTREYSKKIQGFKCEEGLTVYVGFTGAVHKMHEAISKLEASVADEHIIHPYQALKEVMASIESKEDDDYLEVMMVIPSVDNIPFATVYTCEAGRHPIAHDLFTEPMCAIGHRDAVIAAMGANAIAPEASAGVILRAVAKVTNAIDIEQGITECRL